MDKEFRPIKEVLLYIQKELNNQSISLDDVLTVIIKRKTEIYALPTEHYICWSYNKDKDFNCITGKCDQHVCEPSRIQNSYQKICPQYYEKLRNRTPTPMRYLCKGNTQKGLLLTGPRLGLISPE